MLPTRFIRLFFVWGVCFGFGGVALADTTLIVKFQKGETQKQRMTQKQTMSMVLAGQPPVKTGFNQVMDMELTCEEVSDTGVATLRQRLPRVRMTMELPPPLNKTLEYDTDAPAPNDPILMQLERVLRPMIGVDFSMKCNPQGKISDFKMPPKALDGLKANPAAAMGGDMFSEQGMKQVSEQGGVQVPEKALKVGDKWETTFEMKSPIGIMKLDREYTYLGPDAKTGWEKLGVTVKTSLTADPNSKLPAMVTLKSGVGTGEVLFNNQLGRVAKNQMKTQMEMEITAGGQVIQQSITSEVMVEDTSVTNK